jgi:hypothetical protein
MKTYQNPQCGRDASFGNWRKLAVMLLRMGKHQIVAIPSDEKDSCEFETLLRSLPDHRRTRADAMLASSSQRQIHTKLSRWREFIAVSPRAS